VDDAFLLAGVLTPQGKYGGALSGPVISPPRRGTASRGLGASAFPAESPPAEGAVPLPVFFRGIQRWAGLPAVRRSKSLRQPG
jgi:hypothetical protein